MGESIEADRVWVMFLFLLPLSPTPCGGGIRLYCSLLTQRMTVQKQPRRKYLLPLVLAPGNSHPKHRLKRRLKTRHAAFPDCTRGKLVVHTNEAQGRPRQQNRMRATPRVDQLEGMLALILPGDVTPIAWTLHCENRRNNKDPCLGQFSGSVPAWPCHVVQTRGRARLHKGSLSCHTNLAPKPFLQSIYPLQHRIACMIDCWGAVFDEGQRL